MSSTVYFLQFGWVVYKFDISNVSPSCKFILINVVRVQSLVQDPIFKQCGDEMKCDEH